MLIKLHIDNVRYPSFQRFAIYYTEKLHAVDFTDGYNKIAWFKIICAYCTLKCRRIVWLIINKFV